MRRFLSGPAISRLTLTPRMTVTSVYGRAHGPPLRVGRIVCATLEGVDAHAGIQFTEAQLDRAADGKPGRILHVPDSDTKEATGGHAQAQA